MNKDRKKSTIGSIVVLAILVVVWIFISSKTGNNPRSTNTNSADEPTQVARPSKEEIIKRTDNVKVVAYPKKTDGSLFEYRFDVLNQSKYEFKGKIEILLYKAGDLKDKIMTDELKMEPFGQKEKIQTEPMAGDYDGFSYKLIVNGITINRDDISSIE